MAKSADKNKTKAQLIWELQALRKELDRATSNSEQEISQFKKVLQVVNSTLNLDDVIEKVMEALTDVFDFNQLSIFLFNSEKNVLEATNWYGDAASDELMENFINFPLSIEWDEVYFVKSFLDNEISYVSPVTEKLLTYYSKTDRQMFEWNPYKSIVIFPLEVQEKVIGIINFVNTQKAFNLDAYDLNRVAGYVAQIATTINNAYLVRKSRFALEEAQKKEKELSHLNKIIRTSNSTLDFDAVFEAILDGLKETFDFTAIGIQIVDEEAQQLNIYKVYGDIIKPEQVVQWRKIKISSQQKTSVSSFVFKTGEIAYFPNITPDMPFAAVDKEIYDIEAFTSYLAYPLNVQGKRIGVISFFCKEEARVLSASDLEKIEQYLLSVSNSINNANNFLELKRSNQIFSSLLEASASMQRKRNANEILSFAVSKLEALFPNIQFGAMLHGARPENIETAIFTKLSKTEQDWLLENARDLVADISHKHLINFVRSGLGAITSKDRIRWYIFPLKGMGEKIKGNLVAKGPGIQASERRMIQVFLEQVSNIIENMRLTQQVERLANTDILTEAYNPFYFEQALDQMAEQSQSSEFGEFSLFLLEVMGLNEVDKKFGLEAKDQLLVSVSKSIFNTTRQSDVVCRIKENVFAILSPHTSQTTAEVLHSRLRSKLSNHRFSIQLRPDQVLTLPANICFGHGTSKNKIKQEIFDQANGSIENEKRQFYQALKFQIAT